MLKRIVVSVLLIAFTGCSAEYEANMKTRREMAWFKTTNQRMAVGDVMAVINKVLNPFEEEALKQIAVKNKLSAGDVPYPTNDSQYAMNLMASVMGSMVYWDAQAELQRARAQAISYLTPIIQAIYADNEEKFGTPMSSNEVFAKLVGTIPFVATVGGMYGLGVAGINAAGQSISGTFDNSNINTGANGTGGAVGAGRVNQGEGSTDGDSSTNYNEKPVEEELPVEETPATTVTP